MSDGATIYRLPGKILVTGKRVVPSRRRAASKDLENRLAIDIVDVLAFCPGAKAKREWKHGPRPFYLNVVATLRALVDSADLNDPQEFHSLLWLIERLGGSQQVISDQMCVSPAVVNRWVQAAQTPQPDRRRGILESAFFALDQSIAEQAVIPLRPLHGRRAKKA